MYATNITNTMENELFFELLRVSIGNAGCLSQTPSPEKWQGLYAMAEKHALLGVCFAGVMKIKGQQQVPPTDIYVKWLVISAQIQKKSELINKRCVELQRRLQEAKSRSFIMKGQANAALYGGELATLRQPGDIDIMVEGGFKRVNDFVQRTYPTKEVSELEIHYHCFDDTEVEIHCKPFMLDSPKDRLLQMYFKQSAEANYSNIIRLYPNKDITAATLPFNIVHQLVHIHHHLFYEGVGLRQCMDYYFLLMKLEKDDAGVHHALCTITNLGLDRFASALMWMLGYVFGLNRARMLWQPNEKDGRFLLREIMLSGNFGKQDDRQRNLYKSKWHSFWIVHFKTFRLWRFDPWAWFWSPIYRIKGKGWQLVHGYR